MDDAARALSLDQAQRLRARAQRLDPEHRPRVADGVASVVAAVCGLQAQRWSAAALGVRARSADLLVDDVERARQVVREVVWGWFLRGTLHLVAAGTFVGCSASSARSSRRANDPVTASWVSTRRSSPGA